MGLYFILNLNEWVFLLPVTRETVAKLCPINLRPLCVTESTRCQDRESSRKPATSRIPRILASQSQPYDMVAHYQISSLGPSPPLLRFQGSHSYPTTSYGSSSCEVVLDPVLPLPRIAIAMPPLRVFPLVSLLRDQLVSLVLKLERFRCSSWSKNYAKKC